MSEKKEQSSVSPDPARLVSILAEIFGREHGVEVRVIPAKEKDAV